jgi:hypothetical protein
LCGCALVRYKLGPVNFGPRAVAAAVFFFSSLALADNSPPVVLADAPPAAGLPGEGFKNHLQFAVGFGVGPISPSQYNGYVASFNTANGGPASGANANTEIELELPLVTFYAPYYLLVRSGAQFVSMAFPSETLPSGDHVNNYGGILEIPIEFGGHYSFLSDRLVVELAAGPAIAGFISAGLNGSSGATGEQLYANPSVGFDSELRGQYFLSNTFSLGIEIGYRILAAGALHTSDNTNVLVGGNPINLDMSGFHAALMLGFNAI